MTMLIGSYVHIIEGYQKERVLILSQKYIVQCGVKLIVTCHSPLLILFATILILIPNVTT